MSTPRRPRLVAAGRITGRHMVLYRFDAGTGAALPAGKVGTALAPEREHREASRGRSPTTAVLPRLPERNETKAGGAPATALELS
ncbi:hypothetical protein ACGRHY_27240 [Streptomyces sp. HK10]|uniref:hypothetical protein n=1 Tax=Streptomyces sp. HK10 TaxID=3373255 RepID=UPI0037492221